MIFVPLLLGVLAGIILTVIATVLNKNGVSKTYIQIYSLGTMILGVAIAFYGYLVVRGFEGFAYLLLGFPIVVFSIVTFVLNFKRTQSVQ